MTDNPESSIGYGEDESRIRHQTPRWKQVKRIMALARRGPKQLKVWCAHTDGWGGFTVAVGDDAAARAVREIAPEAEISIEEGE